MKSLAAPQSYYEGLMATVKIAKIKENEKEK
jgi:hypothetical protein